MVGNANANGIPFLKRYGIPPAIKNSMVLWYDIARQGATNESMAENPILKDLSGNGHDITCYNFAWSGMSGIGGYAAEVFLGGDFILSTGKATIINKSKVHITHTPIGDAPMYSIYEYRVPANTIIQPTKIKVSGLNNNFIIKGRENNLFEDVLIDKDGIYELPSINNTSNDEVYPGLIVEPADIDCDITIELLPEYPNALVSDGVDDYAYVERLPILTDYTVIAKRIWLSSQLRDTFASKSNTYGKGAFIFEVNESIDKIYSYGGGNNIDIVNDIISYQTTNEYNGKKINKGSGEDTDKLWISKLRNNNTDIGSFALYSFLLFNRTLTADEIEWVKTNLISVRTNE